jgi:hypothetical protein
MISLDDDNVIHSVVPWAFFPLDPTAQQWKFDFPIAQATIHHSTGIPSGLNHAGFTSCA